MSTQLILYPQTYNGQPNAISLSTTQKIVDGINFSSINTSSSHNSSAPVFVAAALSMQNAPASIVNTWYRYRTNVSGVPSLPTQTGGSLVLSATTTDTSSGVYQKLSNLIVGAPYAFSFIWTGGTSGSVKAWQQNGATGNTSSFGPTVAANNTFQLFYGTFFAASVNDDVIAISFEDTAASTIDITEITCVQAGVDVAQFNNFTSEDGQVICDLYQEEDIPLTLSIDDFKNVAEQVQSYSKDFNLPATKRNNLIFNNMFEVTRADDGLVFNPYVRTQCVLKQDGFILFQGYLRMIDVQEQDGEISYNVNLYSEVIALADILKERTFSDLDFSELQHDYNKNSIKNSWYEPSSGTGLPLSNPLPTTSYAYDTSNQPAYGASQTNVLKYPFIDWTGEILLATPNSNGTNDRPELASLEQVFRPCVQLKYLINKIFEETPFTWASNFFDGADFEKLFMDFNWGSTPTTADNTVGAGYYIGYADNYAPNGSYGNLQLTYPSGNLAQVNYDTATNKITATTDNTRFDINYSYEIEILNVSPDPSYSARWLLTRSSGAIIEVDLVPIQTITANQSIIYSGSLSQTLNSGDTLEPQFYSNWTSTNSIVQNYDAYSVQPLSTATVTIQISGGYSLNALRGEIGQWEFLKGIMTMFNLVSMVDDTNPNNILIEPYSDVFIKNTNSGNTSNLTLAARSIEYDWTDKVDVSQMQLTPLTDLNKTTIFKFVEDDKDYVFNVYKESTSGHLYGSKVFDASGFTILEGIKEVIAEPFAATVSKPLYEQFPIFVTPAIYAKKKNRRAEGFDNEPRIFYNNGRISTGTTYYIPEQNGLFSENQEFILQFSHLSDIPTISSTPPVVTDTRDFVFESSQLFQPIGNSPTNNLFNNYWLPYYAELYNADTRMMTLKVNLTPSDINIFKMTDTVMIKNRSFRVNKIDYKPNDLATVEFILLS
jgi:hypothetical protein